MLVFGKTDVGKVRESNQDTYQYNFLDENTCFAVVCDGMGGENGGQVASSIACQTIHDSIYKNYKAGMGSNDYKQLIVSALSDGNIAVYDESLKSKQYIGMGTTAVLVLVHRDRAYIAHVGDSRVYMLKEKDLYQITKDHSMVQNLIDQKKITKEEALTHPQRSMITRAIGVSCFVDIDYIEVSQLENSKILLCSDGLSNTCSDELIRKILLNEEHASICDELVEHANNAGGYDNITVVLMV